jgi:large subunit ribosomal protein L19
MLQHLQRVAKLKNPKLKKENFTPGDTVDVYVKVREGEKERVQIYTGTVIKIQGAGTSRTFTVRKISDGIGVERCFPFASPAVEKVTIVSHGHVKRAKLYYLRNLSGKKARIEFDLATGEGSAAEAAAIKSAGTGAPKAEGAEAAPKEPKTPKAKKESK